MTNKMLDKFNSDKAFKDIVAPFLRSHGYIDSQIANMVPRVRFGKDYKNWSIRMEDNNPDDVPTIERLVRIGDKQKLILQAFVNYGKVLSYGVVQSSILTQALKIKQICSDRMNNYENVYFRCVKFIDVKRIFGDTCYIFNS